MAKLSRVFQNLFGLIGDQAHFGQFGSRAVTGPGVPTKDPASIQALSAFTGNGWLDAIVAGSSTPFLEDMNGLMYLIFYQLCYGMQEGVPEWNAATTYYVGSIVKKTGTTELYGSLTDSNLGNALPSQTSNGIWNYLNPQTVAAGVISDFGGASAPFGWLACDGTAYAAASYPALYAAIGGTWDTFNGSGAPGVGQFRVPDLRGRAGIGAGTGSGLSPRAVGQAVGEETHVLTTAEMPVHAHTATTNPSPATVGQSLATIDGAHGGNFLPVGSPSQILGVAIGNAGGGGAHNNMQPSGVVTKIIKT